MRTFLSVFISFSLLISACGEGSEDESGSGLDDAQKVYENVEDDIKVTRDEFVSDVQDELENIEDDMAEIRLEIEDEAREADRELRKEWEELTREKNELKEDLEALKERSQDNWHKKRSEINGRLDSLKTAFENLREDLDIN